MGREGRRKRGCGARQIAGRDAERKRKEQSGPRGTGEGRRHEARRAKKGRGDRQSGHGERHNTTTTWEKQGKLQGIQATARAQKAWTLSTTGLCVTGAVDPVHQFVRGWRVSRLFLPGISAIVSVGAAAGIRAGRRDGRRHLRPARAAAMEYPSVEYVNGLRDLQTWRASHISLKTGGRGEWIKKMLQQES